MLNQPACSSRLVAAITLGSNSFNLLIAKPTLPSPTVVAKYKRKVRLARGLAQDGLIGAEPFAEGLACLAWFGECLSQHSVEHVAVMATAALRQANNAQAFIAAGEPLLGHRIEVISGEREAELIYQGMRGLTAIAGSVIAIDIGGASTEVIIGDEHDIQFKHSFELGCVTCLQRHLADGLSAQAFANIKAEVEQTLAPFNGQLQPFFGLSGLGISGSVRSVFELYAAQNAPITSITPVELEGIVQQLLEHGAELPGLDLERIPTFAAGVVLLLSFMQFFSLPALYLAEGGLREGVLLQLSGCHSLVTS